MVIVSEPRLSTAEQLRGEYGDEWDIWREVLPGGRHGDWIAERTGDSDEKLRADTVAGLADLLKDATR